MRGTGLVDSPRGMRPGDHLCWVYDDVSHFEGAAVDFLAEGIEHGERVALLSHRPVADARLALAPLGDLDGLIRRGVLDIGPVAAAYRAADPSHAAAAQVDAYAAAARAAVADGFRGLRIAADASTLATEVGGHRIFAGYEHLVDRAMRTLPFTAMCAYDAAALEPGFAGELVALHPLTNRPTPGFHLVASAPGVVALSGEVDAAGADVFAAVLSHVAGDAGDVLRIDGTGLTFIDHRGLLALDAVVGPARVSLTTPFAAARAVAELLDLRRLEVRVP